MVTASAHARLLSQVPSLSWLDVMTSLDHPYFVVRSKMSFKLLTEILLQGFGGSQTFPISYLYRPWNGNKSGQVGRVIVCIN